MIKCDKINIISVIESARVTNDGYVNGTRQLIAQIHNVSKTLEVHEKAAQWRTMVNNERTWDTKQS